MLACVLRAMSSSIAWRRVGPGRLFYPTMFMAAFAVFFSVQSVVAFDDRFGDGIQRGRPHNARGRDDVASTDRGGAPDTMGRGGRGGGTDSRGGDGGGSDSRGGDGGGFPGPGGRNSGGDNRGGNDGDDGSSGRGRGRGH